MRRALIVSAALISLACPTAAARAVQSVRLRATLSPERLGRPTTVGFDVRIAVPANLVPPPLTSVQISYPGNLGIALSGLGLATCSSQVLEASGPDGCPANSRMGFGRAVAEIQLGPDIVQEPAEVAIVRSPVAQDGRLALLFYADGISPVSAQIVFPAVLAPAARPFGGQVQVTVPLVPSIPEASDVAMIAFSAALGPRHLTYYERVGSRIVAYHPKGVLLPNRCPRGGFPFAARLVFLDGSSARTAVPCPRRSRG